MRVIACLDDGASELEQEQARRELTRAGFRLLNAQSETEALGILVGEMPKDSYADLQKKLGDGGIGGLASLEVDGLQSLRSGKKKGG